MNVVIIGGGQVGSYLAKLLLDNKCIVNVIEQREDVLAKIKKELPIGTVIAGNGTDPAVLESAGII
jgi:trk system potassium uptake protein TrkA